MDKAVIETVDLTKVYGNVTAVDRLNLTVGQGEIFGFLGPNGAGKTTTILMLLGLTEPTSGTARVGGFDPAREPLKVKRVAGYLPENVGFYSDLTARQNLRYIAELNGLRRKDAEAMIAEALEAVGLADVADKEVGKFSKGMKQRLGIADVLIKNPRLVILDEPTTGIDPEGVRHILDLIVSMAHDRGITVVLSSHLLHQVQEICDRVGIIFKGRMVAQGSIRELGMAMTGENPVVIEAEVTEMKPGLVRAIESLEGVRGVEVRDRVLTVRSDRDVRGEISRAAAEQGVLLMGLRTQDYGLEDIYLKYFREG